MRVTHRILALAAAGLFGVGSHVKAQSVEFKGHTEACFYDTPGQCNPSSTLSSDGYFLHFLSSPFDVQTVNGFASVDLGYLGLIPGLDSYTGDNFLLNVFFNAPTVTGAPAVFTAAVKGAVHFFRGGAALVFDPNTQVYDFNSGETAGTFALAVNDVSVDPLSASPLTGTFRVTSVTASPEPATLALMATGFIGLIPVARMRRKKNEA